jgi:hypothetical protein
MRVFIAVGPDGSAKVFFDGRASHPQRGGKIKGYQWTLTRLTGPKQGSMERFKGPKVEMTLPTGVLQALLMV